MAQFNPKKHRADLIVGLYAGIALLAAQAFGEAMKYALAKVVTLDPAMNSAIALLFAACVIFLFIRSLKKED